MCYLLKIFLIGSAMVLLCASALADSTAILFRAQSLILKKIERQCPKLNLSALLAGVVAYDHLRTQGHDTQQLLTIVDFSRPSNEKRLWTINMATGKTDYFTYVAQGENTGTNVAKYFSNKVGSHESSIGVYLTGKIYHGIAGRSMRLHGLDRRFNSNAFVRGIVVHPDPEVSKTFVEKNGHLGHTEGCFGLSVAMAAEIIPAIKNDTVFVAFYPDLHWLLSSSYERKL